MDIHLPIERHAHRRAAEIIAAKLLGPEFDLIAQPSISRNRVFLASSDDKKIIIRLGGSNFYPQFKQAAQVMNVARQHGLPVPKVLLVGYNKIVPRAYQVTEYLEGTPGNKFGHNTLKIWEQTGEIAHVINQIKTTGLEYHLFSRTKAVSWQAFITQKIGEQYNFLPTFRHWKSRSKKPFFTKEQLDVIFRAMEPLKRYEANRLCLIHMDLAPRNVLVDHSGKITAILDWDTAKSFPPPHQVATTTFWISPEEAKAFKIGYDENFDPDIILAFQLYEYLTQIPYKTLKQANTARDIILWRLSLRSMPSGLSGTEHGLSAAKAPA